MTCHGNCNQGRDCDCGSSNIIGWIVVALASVGAGTVLGWSAVMLARWVFP